MKSIELLKIMPPKLPDLPPKTEEKFSLSSVIGEVEKERVLCCSIFEKKKEKYRIFLWSNGYRTYLPQSKEWSKRVLRMLPDMASYSSYGEVYAAEADEKQIADFCHGFSNATWNINSYQSDILSAKRKSAVKEPMQEVLSRLPPLPNDFEEVALEQGFAFSRYSFYQSRKVRNPLTGQQERKYFTYCTHCKQEFELDWIPSHKERDHCSNCQGEVEYRRANVQRSKLIDKCNYAIFQPCGEEVFLSFLTLTRNYNIQPKDIKTKISCLEIFHFTKGKVRRFSKRYHGNFNNWYEKDDWEEVRPLGEVMDDYWLYPMPKGIFKGTCLEHCHLDDYWEVCQKYNWREQPVNWLIEYIRHPAIEHLLTAKLYNLVENLLNHSNKSHLLIKWKNTRPRDLLGVSEPEVREIAAHNLDAASLGVYLKERENGLTLSKEDIEFVRAMNNLYTGTGEFFNQFPFMTAKKYIDRQKRKHYPHTSYATIIGQWRDFCSMSEKLGQVFTREKMPHNLKAAHDRVSAMINEQEQLRLAERRKAEEKDWNAQFAALSPLTWSYGDLLIRPVQNREELLLEGQTLDHCVGGYANSVMSMLTHIFLIRKKTEPDTPYFTLNLSPKGKFIQCHGYKNDREFPGSTRPQEIKDFEQKWLKQIAEPFFKKQKSKERKTA